jgi:hypothetical protein
MRRGVLLVAAVVAALASAASTGAADVTRFTIPVDDTFGPILTEECGFDVFVETTGTATVTLIETSEGVREIDLIPGGRITYSAPSQGTSFSFEANLVGHTLYPQGVSLGAPAIVTLTGLLGHVAGIGADAGSIKFETTVVDFSPEGIPITGDPIEGTLFEHGNRESGETIVAAICARLTAG